MKLLKVSADGGHYRTDKGAYSPIDKIDKEALLRLTNWTLTEEEIDFDAYDEKAIKNQAHQVIYKSILQKLAALRQRREEFIDESARLFLDAYDKYRLNK